MANTALQEIVKQSYFLYRAMGLRDPVRLETLYSTQFWKAPQVEKLRQFCITAADSLDAPESYVSMIRNDEVVVIGSNSTETTYDSARVPIDYGICPNLVGVGQPLIVGNTREYPVICEAGSVTEDGGVLAYLGVPLEFQGYIVGSLCVIDYKVRDWSEIDALMLSHLAIALVTLHEVKPLTNLS